MTKKKTMTAETASSSDGVTPPETLKLSLEEALALALEMLSQGNATAALTIYAEAMTMVPERPDVLHFHGVALHQAGNSEAGLDLIIRSLEIKPDEAGWWNNKGNVLRGMGRLDDAIDCYRQATILAPDFADPFNNLGVVQRTKQNPDIAEACFARAIELRPGFGDAYSNLGNLLVSRNRTAEGINLLLKAVTLSPQDRMSKRALAYAYGHLGDFAKARGIYTEWLADEPGNPIALHHMAAVSGDVVERASDDYVKEVFDAFAGTFDTKLATLDYRAPDLVNTMLLAWAGKTSRKLDIADAGCGTGLCGPGLRARASRLVGVDLSGAMLGKARARACYDELVEDELTAFLKNRPGAFDAIVSADTLCYFGVLSEAFKVARTSLRPGGVFVFTVEALPDGKEGFVLNHNGRYVHSRSYVETELKASDLMLTSMVREVLRNESGVEVEGFVVFAERAGTLPG